MVKCSFCGRKILEGGGKMFVRSDARIFYFCDSKCQKNFKLGREGKNTRWTETFRKGKEKK